MKKFIFTVFLFTVQIAHSETNPNTIHIDSELNRVYQEAFKILENPLKKSQRAWLQFRKLDCDAQLSNFGTSPFVSENYENCINNHNLIRIKQLENMMLP